MAKSSTRFRNRKINFKTRIPVRTGIHALDAFDEDGLEGGMDVEDEKEGHKDTGVDKEEEGEVHLQAVLASSSASVTRGTSFTLNLGARNSGVSISTTQKPKAFIPTPDSTGTIDQALFDRLYPSDAFVDPISYIKFSDTVEEAQIGAVGYTMDEEDEDWLEAYNAAIASNSEEKSSVNSSPVASANASGDASNRNGGRARVKGDKGKGSEKDMVTGPIGEDDFEEIMELFERITEQKAPMAHVNTASLPHYEDFDDAFIGSHVRSPWRIFAKSIYPHWKERRLKRSGKVIIPQLDYDESNEQNPYVCFRRRELKTSRKTRRSDAQNIERLVRLRNDLFAAHALMLKTRDRERLKLETVQLEKKIFEGRVALRDLKRRTGEAEGDEDLLIGRREKKKKRDDNSGSIRLSIRKPEGNNSGFSSSTLASTVEDLRALKERAAIIHQRIERDIAKKREADGAFEDFTDNPYTPRQPSPAARCWRTVESIPTTSPASNGARESLGFASQYHHPAGTVRTSFRRRVGRGGRIMLDRISSAGAGRRILPRTGISEMSGEESEEDADVTARRAERFRFDMDTSNDFPTAEEPIVVDDYAFEHMVRRAALLRPADVESLTIDGSYLEEAYRFASREPERHPPPQVINRLAPPRAVLPTQAGGPGGIPVGAQSANAISSIMAAASQAHRVAQQQAQLKRTAAGSPQLPPNGSPLNQTLPLSMPIQSGFANHLGGSPQPYGQPQRTTSGNGIANGVSRPPFTAQQQQQILLQQQQMQQQLGQPSEAGSRPSSATSHHSPSLLAQGLPPSHQSPHSPGGARQLLPIKRTSPYPPSQLLPIAMSNSPVGLPPNYNPFPQVS